ncbi:MAG: hypothetical protein IPH63_02430 [Flavobacteriales bacterium]|nr:hypothetical protein [Flavobacteriales bacterium]
MAFSVGGQLLVARFDDTGALDLSFNSTGYTLVPIGEYAVAYDVAIRPDGGPPRAIQGPTATPPGPWPRGYMAHQFLWPRYRHHRTGYSGTRIKGFAAGHAGIGVGTVGMAFDFDTFDAIAVRYLLNGTLDTSFGTNGLGANRHSAQTAHDAALQVMVAPDLRGRGGQQQFRLHWDPPAHHRHDGQHLCQSGYQALPQSGQLRHRGLFHHQQSDARS